MSYQLGVSESVQERYSPLISVTNNLLSFFNFLDALNLPQVGSVERHRIRVTWDDVSESFVTY